MIDLEEKTALIAELHSRLEKEYLTLLAAQKATVEGATHEEAKPENSKDTRALEQSYLARGQAERVVQLRADLKLLAQLKARPFSEDSKVSMSAIVQLQDDAENTQLYLLAPAGAGEELSSSAGMVKVVTPTSPLGRALQGAHLDDDIELRTPKGKRALTLTALT